MSKKYLSVAFAYVGVIIGAGLASGQDLLQYFLSFGAKGLIGIAVLGVLNVVFGVVAVGYAASLMGFKKLIGGMYPIIGWLGVALLVVLAVGWLRERSAVLREENLRRELIRVLVRKHADDLEYTDEHRAQARTLAQASVVDGTELRREADSIAEQIGRCRRLRARGSARRRGPGRAGDRGRPSERLSQLADEDVAASCASSQVFASAPAA